MYTDSNGQHPGTRSTLAHYENEIVAREDCRDLEVQRGPFAPDALHVEGAPMYFKAIGSVWRRLGCRGDAQAGPHRYGWLLVVEFGHERHGAIAFEIRFPAERLADDRLYVSLSCLSPYTPQD